MLHFLLESVATCVQQGNDDNSDGDACGDGDGDDGDVIVNAMHHFVLCVCVYDKVTDYNYDAICGDYYDNDEKICENICFYILDRGFV